MSEYSDITSDGGMDPRHLYEEARRRAGANAPGGLVTVETEGLGNVVSLDSRRPHISGVARCLECGHEHAAVAPVGVTDMECPACGLMRAVWWSSPWPEDGWWQCDCGGAAFAVNTIRQTVCLRCGSAQEFGD